MNRAKVLGIGMLALFMGPIAHADVPTQLNPQASINPRVGITLLTQQIDSGSLAGQKLADAYGLRCRLKVALHDISGALPDCTQSIMIFDSAAVRALRGGIYGEQKDSVAALEDFAALSQFLPKSPIGHALSAGIYWQDKNLDGYAAESDAAIALSPNALDILKPRAELYFINGYWSRAATDYQSILKQTPSDAEFTRYLGDALSYSGDLDGGMRSYDLALKLDPVGQADLVPRAKAISYFGQYKYSEAETQARISADKAPTDPYGLLWLALTRAHSGKADEHDFARRAVAVDQNSWPWPLIAYHLGQVREEDVWSASALGKGDIVLATQKCEAQFYLGEEMLARDKDHAVSLLRQVASTCMKGNIEYVGAVYELRAMGENIPL